MNYREVLGVPASASPEDIQAAFRKEALKNHPDVSASPEAAEAFMRIKEARDALIKEAAAAPGANTDESIRRATDDAVRATTSAAYGTSGQQQSSARTFVDDLYAGMTDEQIAYIQELDRLARRKAPRFFHKRESDEVRRHRKTIKTRDDRLSGRY